MATSIPEPDSRTERLRVYFRAIVHGKRKIQNTRDAKTLFEAVSCQEDKATCLEQILASPHAVDAVKISVRIDVSTAVLNKSTAVFVNHFSDPAIRQLCGGQYLHRLLAIIADPPTLVNELCRNFDDRLLEEDAIHALAWLLHESLTLPPDNDLRNNATDIARTFTSKQSFTSSSSLPVRTLGHKIQKLLELTIEPGVQPGTATPGGRHDNDHADFRKVSVLPTADELLSAESVFYRRLNAVYEHDDHERPAVHLDNQFRLLREDMLSELRLDLQVAQGKSKTKRHVTKIDGLTLAGLSLGAERKRKQSAFCFDCTSLQRLVQLESREARKKYLMDHPGYLKHQSLGCLLQGNEFVAFGTLERDLDLLVSDKPRIVLRISDVGPVEKTLLAAKTQGDFQFLLVNTPIFAYGPILRRLQGIVDFPLAQQLLSFGDLPVDFTSPFDLDRVCQSIILNEGRGLRSLLGLSQDVDLDTSQADSLLAALRRSVSLIQGPPGTGKSFLGALIAKALYENTGETILVLCFTNHALDQFLEDLLGIGIPESAMVRLGSKSSARTDSLKMSNQAQGRITPAQYDMLREIDSTLSSMEQDLNRKFDSLDHLSVTDSRLMEFLEFSEHDHFFDAFTAPVDEDGMSIVGSDGKRIKSTYLIERWRQGRDAGTLCSHLDDRHQEVWAMKKTARDTFYRQWKHVILQEHTASLAHSIKKFDNEQYRMQEIFGTRGDQTLKSKRVIGCTTTGAAMYMSQIRNATPGIVLVEEAGEILESHILSAMTEYTKQLILIGDHKQLRPKVNDYKLSVEKGDGYDLNMSMFERLVVRGFPHESLRMQHRMPPEISGIVKHLTYPHLEDAPSTQQRDMLRGFQDRVIFYDHERPEEAQEGVHDRRDEGSKVSRRNEFEADMVLGIVRYLAQQGYGTDKIVVLTPYLGQLSLLKAKLSGDHDPILGDLDSHDLVAAGLMTAASAAHGKRSLRLATVDNYQGEQSDVVIVSLVRSNAQGDIGFMSSPQRLNVLLSRARIGLIMIGNSATFLKSKKGSGTWSPFLDFMKDAKHLYDGIPVVCQRHQSTHALLQTREDFLTHCPDGGCCEPCGTLLSCGVHLCPQSCHQLSDHSKVECLQPVDFVCSKGHKRKIKCCKQTTHKCQKCAEDERQMEKRRQRDLELDERREEQQRLHAERLAEIQDEIDYQKRLLKEGRDEHDMESAIKQRQQDLKDLRKVVRAGVPPSPPKATNSQQASPSGLTGNLPQTSPSQHKAQPSSTSRPTPGEDWEHRKSFLLEKNEAMDELMSMIGLENVKEQFLGIKDKIDLAVRQNIDLREERFNVSLLGNPGTGKTTVARLFAKFLTSVGALSGAFIKETTGSSLASDGVTGCKLILEEILNNGGGALFIDEAYQLASGSSFGGKAVLDFLLAEVENYRGKIVFIIAGYNKQMEDFFAHNPGFPSRFPNVLQFQDYSDEELRQIFAYQIHKRFRHKMELEDGIGGLFARIVARKVGRGRGREGFGNARAIENVLATITTRQAKRIRQERRAGRIPNDLFLTKEDLIGPEPSNVLQNNHSWKKLQDMIGLKSVKDSLKALLTSIDVNYHRELEEKSLIEFSLNRIFVGSPGTGKTTVAKLYGTLLADLGLLSNGEVIIKQPADFIGAHLGESEKKTKGILASTIGKVLVIDEAYGLYSTNATNDSFKTAVIDAIVGDVQSVPGEDRCVLLLGYWDQMQTMLQEVNPGLSRRFPIDSAFKFEDFTDDELSRILDLKLKQQDLKTTDQGKRVAMKMLQRARNRPNFGNGGEVDIVLDKAKFSQQKRMAGTTFKNSDTLEAVDFDADFDRGNRAATNVAMLFKGVVDADAIVQQLEQYQRIAASARARNMDPREQLPFNFLFRGPPGTGKTTTARKMGKVYYDMEFLSDAQVIECSATELVGQYVGHTGPKTQKMLEKALGKVLFIDEAYRLADGQFAKEAMDEIVDCLTKEKFHQKLIVILAGYDQDINRLMTMNPGLTSRFPETISFNSLDPDACIALLATLMEKRKKVVDFCVLHDPSEAFHRLLRSRFLALSSIDNWANARDVQTIQKSIFGKLLATSDESTGCMVVTEQLVLQEIDAMIKERSNRAQNVRPNRPSRDLPQRTRDSVATPKATSSQNDVQSDTGKSIDEGLPSKTSPVAEVHIAARSGSRDPDVPDDVWQQLEMNKQAQEEQEAAFAKLLETEKDTEARHVKAMEEEAHAKAELEAAIAAQAMQAAIDRNKEAEREAEERRIERVKALRAAADETKRRLEAERIKRELARRAREEAELRRRQEAEAQKKLRMIGKCVRGYQWIKEASGYRCAGGAHFVSDAQLEATSV